MRKVIISIIAGVSLTTACDGPYYRVVVEEIVPAEEYICPKEEVYNPNLIDPYSEDTNWYIDETGNIIWRH